jgi:NAD(P)-dependent dehydrogenase (short-subunit alcohol dehydrogenase family)
MVGSMAGRFIVGEQPVGYHVAKASINQLVRYYAVALGPKGIRVNGVSPGTIARDSQGPSSAQEELGQLSKRIIPLGRMGTALDVAQAVEFLCSPEASFITGQEIVVDGGLSLRSQEAVARELALQAVSR